MLIRFATLVGVISFLFATGCTGPLLDRMDLTNSKIDDTNNKIENTNEKIRETKDLSNLTEALGMVKDKGIYPGLRYAAAQSVIKLAPEDRIWQYIGAVGPLEYPSMMEGDTELPNISIIASEPIGDSTLGPISHDVHECFLMGVRRFEKMALVSARSKLSPETKKLVVENYIRYVRVATALQGAHHLVHRSVRDEDGNEIERVAELTAKYKKEMREDRIENIRKIASLYHIDSEEREEAEELIAHRLVKILPAFPVRKF